MIIIAGLGNPGEKYSNTRHNAGFMAIDKLKENYGFPDFVFSKNFNSFVSKGLIREEKALIVKPRTFMNNSGKAIKKILNYYKAPLSSLRVFHDDIDLPVGKIKISKGRGAAGHKGVMSIINETGSKEFKRIRIGISPEEKPEKTELFVLKKFKEEEKEKIDNVIGLITGSI